MFVKAIFDEPTERTNWPSSQQNPNVNEDVFGTQVEQQLQDDTVCLSYCKLYFSTIAELPVQSGGWSHISVCPDLPGLLFL